MFRLIFIGACLLLASWRPALAQGTTATVSWDPAPILSGPTAQEGFYRIVYGSNALFQHAVFDADRKFTAFTFQVLDRSGTYYAAVATCLRATNTCGPASSEVTLTFSGPPPVAETCAADGTGNGIDEDLDGMTDEGCKPPPVPPMSSFGSTNPTVSPLIDNLGRAWTIAQDGRILINGAPAAGGGGDLLVWWSDAVMYARNSTWPDSNGSWWKWDNAEAAWKVSSDPRIPPPPPPSHPELCAADGTGNGIDEDMDGLTDEDCKPAPTPPDTAAPEVSLVIGRRTGNNYPVTITTDDDSGIDHVEVLVDGVLQVRMQLPTSGCCTWATKVLIKASGTHTITAKAWDPAGNKGEASATVKR